jgi:hypothetical protein
LSVRHDIPVYAGGVISDLSVELEFIRLQHGSDSYLGLDLKIDVTAYTRLETNYDKDAFYEIRNGLCDCSYG